MQENLARRLHSVGCRARMLPWTEQRINLLASSPLSWRRFLRAGKKMSDQKVQGVAQQEVR